VFASTDDFHILSAQATTSERSFERHLIGTHNTRRRGKTFPQLKNRFRSMPSAPANEDDIIRLAVERQLQASRHPVLRSVRCIVEDGVVVLYGTVPSYHAKQIAQMVAMKLEMALRVENRCEVEHSSRDSGSILSSPKEDK
jgi:osmotically-inducible protein OsmY